MVCQAEPPTFRPEQPKPIVSSYVVGPFLQAPIVRIVIYEYLIKIKGAIYLSDERNFT
jgi:hypothetical protein